MKQRGTRETYRRVHDQMHVTSKAVKLPKECDKAI